MQLQTLPKKSSHFSHKGYSLLALLCLLICSAAFSQTIRYVKPGGTGDGSSWVAASGDLQAMITAAGAGDQVWVAVGTYKPIGTDRAAAFSMKNDCAIYGGFAGTEAGLTQRNWKTNVTTLSGDIGVQGDNSDNCYHVVGNVNNGLNASAVLDGFTITGGNANNTAIPNEDRGGGMYNDGASPTVTNCIFVNNSAMLAGGMLNRLNSPVITNCLFTNNTATSQLGSGVFNGANSRATYLNCAFEKNNGSTVYNSTSTPFFTNCVLYANIGDAIINGSSTHPVLTNCVLYGNTRYGIFNTGDRNSTFISNSVLWGNGAGTANTTLDISYSIVQGGYAGTGNLDKDPLFVNAAAGDFRLQPCSPAIDAGSDAANNSTADLDGNSRKIDAIPGGSLIDMGAYEFSGSIPSYTFYKDGDADGFGNPTDSITRCLATVPQGYVTNNLDCDDIKATYIDADGDGFGSTTKAACGVANNTDCDDSKITYQDNDGDGFGSSVKVACGGVANNGDCNDTDASLNPQTVWVKDADGDNYYTGATVTQCASPGAGYVVLSTQQPGDCRDNDNAVYPGAPELCGDGKDNNCNGQTDEACSNITVTLVPSLTIEGNSGKRPMLFIIGLNKPAPGNLSVQYKTVDGTATAGADYQAAQGTVSFSKGQWLKLIIIYVNGDRLNEDHEQFAVQLSNPVSVNINGTGKATGIILDDDGPGHNNYRTTNVLVQAKGGTTEETAIAEMAKKLIEEAEEIKTAPGGLKAFPNPSTTYFTVQVGDNKTTDRVQLRITDAVGRTIELRAAAAGSTIQLGTNLQPGVYYVEAVQGREKQTLKLLKSSQ